jgi:hypothetical protein
VERIGEMEERYIFNENQIVHEVLDGEVVLVNLDSGYYYILQGTGSVIWQALAGGATVAETVSVLLRRHTGDAAEVGQAVRAFLNDLVQEALLQPAGSAPSGDRSAPPPDEPLAATPFTPPLIFRYTDMANLVQMDPIREYDETGWPSRRSAAPKSRS